LAKFSGGTRVDSKGYLVIKAGPQRDRRVHELIAEAMLGRELEKWEQAHHKDEDKLNCDWRNIEILDARKHGAVSSRQYHFLKENVWAKETAEWKAYFEEANHGTEQASRYDDGDGETDRKGSE
jgi:HNH endonuclease